MARTLKPSLLTVITISSTPGHYLDRITDYLTDIHYLKNAALFTIRKVTSRLNT